MTVTFHLAKWYVMIYKKIMTAFPCSSLVNYEFFKNVTFYEENNYDQFTSG